MFPQGKVSAEAYEAIKQEFCYGCSVRGDCLSWAIRHELDDKYVSRGVWGASPDERKALIRRIHDTPAMCWVEAVRYWLLGYPLPAPNVARNVQFSITV